LFLPITCSFSQSFCVHAIQVQHAHRRHSDLRKAFRIPICLFPGIVEEGGKALVLSCSIHYRTAAGLNPFYSLHFRPSKKERMPLEN